MDHACGLVGGEDLIGGYVPDRSAGPGGEVYGGRVLRYVGLADGVLVRDPIGVQPAPLQGHRLRTAAALQVPAGVGQRLEQVRVRRRPPQAVLPERVPVHLVQGESDLFGVGAQVVEEWPSTLAVGHHDVGATDRPVRPSIDHLRRLWAPLRGPQLRPQSAQRLFLADRALQ